jgi:RNA polymerase sigma-70 factor (ECF subfamily)
LSAREDVDLQLLHDTQTYLRCRFQRQAHARVYVESWERFYRICDPLLRRYARAVHVPRADLTDFIQEIWTELVKTLRDFPYDRQRGRFSSWLYRVVHCKAIDWLRRRTRHPTVSLPMRSRAILAGREDDPAAAYEQKDQQAHVQRVLSELRQQVSPCNYRVFYLRWIEGRSTQEIAAGLDLTPKQVRFRHHRMKWKFLRLYNVSTAKDFPSKGLEVPSEMR